MGVLHVEITGLDLVESLYGWQVFDRVMERSARVLRDAVGRELPEGTLLGVNAVAGDRFAAFVPLPDGAAGPTPALARAGRAVERRLDSELGRLDLAGIVAPFEVRVGHALLSPDPFFRFERRVQAALDRARSLPDRRHRRRLRSDASELARIVRDAEIRTLFQPVVDLRTGDVLGYEALSRGPERGALEMPRALFAASDRLGTSLDLDRACREAALRACAADAIGPRETLFLNVVPRSLGASAAGAAEVLDGLAAAGRRVVLEFPERAADADPDGFLRAVGHARASGHPIALDDVGTGFGGLGLIESVRPDYVKLDLEFVRGIERHRIKQEILRSVVRIANTTGASIVAEGIEARDEAEILLAAGARFGQGYLYARPEPRAAR
jgi:EAL domain-containing protein (putative c-di-GMP-specific phosphodiesterase class I)